MPTGTSSENYDYLQLAVSDDNGSTWENQVLSQDYEIRGQDFIVDGDDVVIIFGGSTGGGSWGPLMMAKSFDRGETW